MGFEGKIYRPWIEAHSMLIQVALGCTHNRCTFCDMFREKRFRVRPKEGILEDLSEARKYHKHVASIFLVDGNVLALRTDFLLEVLDATRSTFPECEKISLYAGLNDLRRKSVEELVALREAGITMAYTGLESGNVETLERVRKGLTPEQAIEGMAKARSAGIDVLVSIILGLAGRERSVEHIQATTKLLNEMRPQALAPMALTIQPGTILAAEVERGDFVQATPSQILEEEALKEEVLRTCP